MKLLRYLLIALAAITLALEPTFAKGKSSGPVYVHGYTKSNGTYVAPHYRSAPNGTKNDDWSPKGDLNPYAGKAGTKPGDVATPSDSSNAQSSAPAASQANPTTTAPASAVTGWLSMKSGMSENELRRQLGAPGTVEGKTGFEIWNYPTGAVFVKDGQVVAWKKVKSP